MSNKIVQAFMKPFLLKMLPDFFVDFDKLNCDFCHVDITNSKQKFGIMATGHIVMEKDWDLLDGIENNTMMGVSVTREQALEFVSSVMISRHPKETVINAKTNLDDMDSIEIIIKNEEVWKRMK